MPKTDTSVIGHLVEMLNDKNAEIDKLRDRLAAAERELEHEAGWCRHTVYEDPTKVPNPDLPVPRLEIRWSTETWGEAVAVYSLVYRHHLGHDVFVPLGKTRTSGALSNRIRPPLVETPLREGFHFANEMRQLRLPGYVIADSYVYEAKLCPKCGLLEEAHPPDHFGEKCPKGES